MSHRLITWLLVASGVQFFFLEGCFKDLAWTFGPLVV